MERIPIRNIPNQELEITLNGQTCRIVLTWRPVAQNWYLSIWAGGNVVAVNRQVTTKALLLREPGRSAGFVGDLWVSPPEGSSNPGRNAWAQGFGLYYLTESESDLGEFR